MVLKLDGNENHLRDFNKSQNHIDAQVHSIKIGFNWFGVGVDTDI